MLKVIKRYRLLDFLILHT